MRIHKLSTLHTLFALPTMLTITLALSGHLYAQVTGTDWIMFGGERQKTGWRSNETTLTVANVGGGGFGQVWQSPLFDADPDGTAAHLFADPLYVNEVAISAGQFVGTFKVVLCGTTAGWVYAVNAVQNGSVAPGTILWGTHLTTAAKNSGIGGDIGVLSTPAVDTSTSPPRMYVTSWDATKGWEAFAVNITDGAV